MATSNSAENSQYCSICLEPYKNPRILPCFHTFCESCLDVHIGKSGASNTFVCPMCRTDIEIRQGGAKAFQSNFYINETQDGSELDVQDKEKSRECELCENGTIATGRCVECSQYLCQGCVVIHRKITVTKEHEVLQIFPRSEKNDDDVSIKKLCNTHGLEYVFYCRSCRVPLCTKCRRLEHVDHAIQSIEESGDYLRSTFIERIGHLKLLLKWNISERKSKAKAEVEEQKLIDSIHLRKKALVKEVEKAADLLVEQVKMGFSCNHRASPVFSEHDVKTKLDTMETAIRNANAVDVVLGSEKRQREVECIKKSLKCVVCPSKNSKFLSGSLSWDVGRVFGSLSVSMSKPEHINPKLAYGFNLTNGNLNVRALLPIGRDIIWLTTFTGNGISCYFVEEKAHHFLSSTDDIDSIAADGEGNIFASLRGQKKIIRIDKTLQVTDHVQLNAYPRGIACSDNNTLIVCSVIAIRFQTHDIAHENNVKELDKSGLTVGAFWPDSTEPFSYPCRVACCKFSSNVVICDRIKSALFVFNKERKHVATYPPKSLQQSVQMTGVACDLVGNIFGNDTKSDTIHMLNSEGELIYFILTKSQLMEHPISLAVDSDNRLIVGHSKCVQVYEYYSPDA